MIRLKTCWYFFHIEKSPWIIFRRVQKTMELEKLDFRTIAEVLHVFWLFRLHYQFSGQFSQYAEIEIFPCSYKSYAIRSAFWTRSSSSSCFPGVSAPTHVICRKSKLDGKSFEKRIGAFDGVTKIYFYHKIYLHLKFESVEVPLWNEVNLYVSDDNLPWFQLAMRGQFSKFDQNQILTFSLIQWIFFMLSTYSVTSFILTYMFIISYVELQ